VAGLRHVPAKHHDCRARPESWYLPSSRIHAIFYRIIADVLHLSESEKVVCGMALGYADPDEIENTPVTETDGSRS
jgi:hypothetical protein